MSGPVYLSLSGGVLGGSALTALFLTGIGGVAVLYPTFFVDEYMPDLNITGKLRYKERLCHPDLENSESKCAPSDLRTSLTRTSPP